MKKKFTMSFGDHQTASMFRSFGFEEIDSISSPERPDFIVFTGGADVSPQLYNQEKHPRTSCSVDRDFYDMNALIAAKLKGVPMLGICRGHQLLHVAAGGTLIQHIEGHANGHTHLIQNIDDSPVPGFEKVSVTSTHHQCVPLEETKKYDFVLKSPDGITEAILSRKHRFFSVQFHPEYYYARQNGCQEFYKNLFDKYFAEMI